MCGVQVTQFPDPQVLTHSRRQSPLSEELTLLVVDTNILLHHLSVLQQFIADVEAQGLPVKVIIPGAVIYELDGQV